jgi:hypothetical protein
MMASEREREDKVEAFGIVRVRRERRETTAENLALLRCVAHLLKALLGPNPRKTDKWDAHPLCSLSPSLRLFGFDCELLLRVK